MEEGKREIFRKSLFQYGGFDKPELMRVIGPKGWIALAAAALIVLSALLWSLFGTISIQVSGQGIFLLAEGTWKVVAPTGGHIAYRGIRIGDRVTKGQIVGDLAQPEMAVEVSQARTNFTKAKERLEEAEGSAYRRDIQLKLAANQDKRKSLALLNENSREYLKRMAEKAAAQEKLLDDGLITPYTLLQTKREIYETQDKIRVNEVEITRMSADDAESVKNHEDKLKTLQKELMEARHKLEQAESKLDLGTKVKSPFAGQVTELLVHEGHLVTQGTPLINLELGRSGPAQLNALIFVPAKEGIKVKPGMSVQISPSFTLKEENGYLLAVVAEVGRMPVSRERMVKLLNNEALVDSLKGKEVPLEIHATPIPYPATLSGYKWSSSGGFPGPLQSGALFEAKIVIEERRPITLVVPYLKKLMGRA